MEAAWFAPVSLYKDFTAKYFTTTCGEKIVTIFVDSERIDRERYVYMCDRTMNRHGRRKRWQGSNHVSTRYMKVFLYRGTSLNLRTFIVSFLMEREERTRE